MRGALLLVALALLPLACGGGGSGATDGGSTAPTQPSTFPIAVAPTASAFTFVVLTDTHVRLPGNPDDSFLDNQGNLDALQATLDLVAARVPEAAFVCVTGDLVGALFSEDPNDYGTGAPNPAETFKTMLDGLGIPVYAALGNHDYQRDWVPGRIEGVTVDDPASIEAVWKKVLGTDAHFSVVHEGVRLVFLNSNRGAAWTTACPLRQTERLCTGSFDAPQMAWLEGQLQSSEPCLLFFHHAPKTDNAEAANFDSPSFLVQDGDPFYGVSATYASSIAGIFVGHGHVWAYDVLHTTIPVFETEAIADPGGVAGSGQVVTVDPSAGRYLVERLSDR